MIRKLNLSNLTLYNNAISTINVIYNILLDMDYNILNNSFNFYVNNVLFNYDLITNNDLKLIIKAYNTNNNVLLKNKLNDLKIKCKDYIKSFHK